MEQPPFFVVSASTGKARFFQHGFYCNPDHWNGDKGVLNSTKENNKLDEFRKRIAQTYEDILKEQGVVSAELLKNTVVGVKYCFNLSVAGW